MRKKINIIIINGKPRSGKDTVIEYMDNYCNINECARLLAYSTIDPVKHALAELGWDMVSKSDDTRNLLAAMKQWWINYSDGPFRWCMDKVMNTVYSMDEDDCVIIFQIREPSEIAKLTSALNSIKSAYGFNVHTLFVNRFSVAESQYGNEADMYVAEYEYDVEIFNNGTLEELKKIVDGYMNNLLGGTNNE